MLDRIELKNYRAIRHLSLDLRPFNVIVGANDTGKTCFLQALESLQHVLPGSLAPLASQKRLTPAQLRHVLAEDELIEFDLIAGGLRFGMSFRFVPGDGSYECVREELSDRDAVVYRMRPDASDMFDIELAGGTNGLEGRGKGLTRNKARRQIVGARDRSPGTYGELVKLLSGIRRIAFQPAEIARPVPLTESSPTTVAHNGFGVARVLLDQKVAGEHFDTIQQRLCDLVPSIDGIRVRTVPAVEARDSGPHLFALLEYRLRQAAEYLPSWCMSDGVLLLTAYVVLSYAADRPRVLLIEEPESGVHPGRLEDIYNTLKSVASGAIADPCQVILTTHSPYLPDCASPDEVLVFARGQDNEVEAVRLSDLPEIETRTKYFNLGELIHMEGEEKIVKEARQHASAGGG